VPCNGRLTSSPITVNSAPKPLSYKGYPMTEEQLKPDLSRPVGGVEGAARELADFKAELAKLGTDPTYPNYAPWPIELPAGHWRALRTALEGGGGEGLGSDHGISSASACLPTDTLRAIRDLIPMDYLEAHPGDLVAAMRAYSEARWRIIERCKKAEAALLNVPVGGDPIPMVLHCPVCGLQHVDESDEFKTHPDDPGQSYWTNPPHRSHLCHGCGTIWRPADVPTEGVARITTTGKADTWSPSPPEPPMTAPCVDEERR
jgi:hypothetical protein